jgi:hypothetical protein
MESKNELTNKTSPNEQYQRVRAQEQSGCRLLSGNEHK